MTASICLLYTVTLSFPGSYHHEICENVPKHPNHNKNIILFPSYSINTTTCTYFLNNQPSSHHLENSMKLLNRPLFTTLPIFNTPPHDDVLKITKTRTYLTGQNTQIPKSIIPSNSFTLSPSTKLDHKRVKLICSSKPISNNIRGGNKTKDPPKTGSSTNAMPNVVKYVTVISLMAFAGGYSTGYGPGMLVYIHTYTYIQFYFNTLALLNIYKMLLCRRGVILD